MYKKMYIISMGRRYSIADARKHLSTVVSEAENGSAVELTRRGESVAVMVSVHEYERMRGRRRAFAGAYADFLSRHDLAEDGLEDSFFGALRERGEGREIDL